MVTTQSCLQAPVTTCRRWIVKRSVKAAPHFTARAKAVHNRFSGDFHLFPLLFSSRAKIFWQHSTSRDFYFLLIFSVLTLLCVFQLKKRKFSRKIRRDFSICIDKFIVTRILVSIRHKNSVDSTFSVSNQRRVNVNVVTDRDARSLVNWQK